MSSLDEALTVRSEEFDVHFLLTKALEDRMMLEAGASVGGVDLTIRHVNTLKSGLIVHLYNIVEAIMSQAVDSVGVALGSSDPRKWSEASLREWLREAVVNRASEGNEDNRLARVFDTSSRLLKETTLGPQKLKKPSGTWDDKVIATFMTRASVATNMPPEMWRRIAEAPHYGDETPLQFLAKRRNAIAHGRKSFENGARDLNLEDIRALANVTLDYMRYTAAAFTAHIDSGAYLAPTE